MSYENIAKAIKILEDQQGVLEAKVTQWMNWQK
jgi:hypothetical protein